MQEHSSSSDRRIQKRFELSLPWSAHTNLDGNTIHAELIDLSENGAKFRFAEVSLSRTLPQGHETEWTVRLPSGSQAQFKASIRWLSRFPEGYILGVRFLNTADNVLLSELLRQSQLPAA